AARKGQPATKAPSAKSAPGEGRSNGAQRASAEASPGKPQAVGGKAQPVPKPQSAPAKSAEPTPSTTPPQRSGKVLASPAVRQRAASLGIDLAPIAGSGEGGRVEHADLDAVLSRGRGTSLPRAPQAGRTEADVEDVPVIGLRRQIAAAMQDSKRRI